MDKSKEIKQTFIPDAPIGEPSLDLFKRWPFAQRLAQIISSRTDPSSIVIGIYGAWGEGKTTVLNFIEYELKKSEAIICVKFNPWRFTNETVLIMSFFQTLAEVFDRKLSSTKERIGEIINKYAGLVAPLSLNLPGIGFSPGQSFAELGKQLSSVDTEKLRLRIQEMLEEEGKRVVVFMDDIDRLDKTEIQAVFKLVKLTADFNYVAYIMAFDDKMVSSALQEQYASASGNAGRYFLEKIIQVPLSLPQADQISLRQLCFQGVDQALNDAHVSLSENQVQEFVRHFVDGIEIRLKNPRMCKRYANALTFAMPILKGEVNVVDLLLIEGIRVFYPDLYETIRQNPNVFSGSLSDRVDLKSIKEKTEAVLEKALELYSDEEKRRAKELLQELFPKLKGIFGNVHYGGSWEDRWSTEQRIASGEYFTRYFTYSIPAGDISDQAINDFLNSSDNKTIDNVAQLLQSFISQRNADKVISKLRQREKGLPKETSKLLAQAIAISGSFFPNPEQMFPFTTAWSQAAILISQLLRNIPKGSERLEIAKTIIYLSQPLTFKLECFRWIRSSDDESEDDKKFSKEDEDQLGRIAAEAVRLDAQSELLHKKYGKEAGLLFWIWAKYIDPQEPVKYLQESFKEDNNVVEFLKTYLPTAWGFETGLSHKGDFERSQFDSVAAIIDPDIIYSKLRSIYGTDLDLAKDSFNRNIDSVDKKIAYQFSFIYHYVKREKDSQQVNPADGE
jgi:hypothetical protein